MPLALQPDANGNRLTRTAATQNQGLAYVTGSNRISTYNGSALAYDGMGNLLGRGSVQFAYAASGRLREVNIGSETWARQVYNGVGELARNRVTADDPCSVDELLLSTDYVLYGPTGQVLHLATENIGASVAVDYIWLDDLPLAQFESAFDGQGVEQGAPKVTWLHADHLGTPRIGTNQAQQITWRWEATEAFGQSLPTGGTPGPARRPGVRGAGRGPIPAPSGAGSDGLASRRVLRLQQGRRLATNGTCQPVLS